MTRTLYVLIVVALALSVAHHIDHLLRGDTGWPLQGGVNAFTYSLGIYPLIVTGLVLSLLGIVGPRFWAVLSLGGALFLAVIHLGPVATDAIGAIPGQYRSPQAGALAVALLVTLIGTLAGTFVYETRLAARARGAVDPERVSVVRRLVAFTVIAYGFSWAWWLPLRMSGSEIDFGQGAPRYIAGLIGPLVAALVVTAATEGWAGVRDLLSRMVRWRVAPRWYAVSVLAPLGLFVVATTITMTVGSPAPTLGGMGTVPGLPVTSILVVWLYLVVVNGLGEEAGWRGYALPLLQQRFRPLAAIGIVSVIWAAWHLPLLPVLTSLEVVSSPAMLPLFWFGLACLSVILAWVYNRSGGSVLIAAIWHGTYNLAAGTLAAQEGINVAFTIFVMAWAAILVWLEIRARRAGREAASPLAPLNPEPEARSAVEVSHSGRS